MTTDEQYMTLAIEEALRAVNHGEWPFGAVVVSSDVVISRNHCAETQQRNVLAHAELQALNDACKALGRNNLSDCAIYCTNEPCLMCAAAIFQAKIPRIIIGASRSDLPHLLRQRKFGVDDLAADSGYTHEIIRSVLKERVLDLFVDIKK